jgi:hypothetical protein
MLYQIAIKVEADAFANNPYKIQVDNYLVEVRTDDRNKVIELCISMNVKNYEDFLPSVKVEPTNGLTTIFMQDSPLLYMLTRLAQHIEALGSFWFGIKKVYWDTPKRSWIPENKDEAKALETSINDYQEQPVEKSDLEEMTPEMLRSLIQNQAKQEYLVLPMSFYREGCNDFKSRRYTTAFINFYFYLDDLYGEGNTKNHKVKEKFNSSLHIREAINQVIQNFQEPDNSENLLQLKKFLHEEKYELNTEGIIDLIVQVRGNLSHFSQKSTKKKGHPLNQDEFRTMAYLLMSICVYTFIELTSGEMPK